MISDLTMKGLSDNDKKKIENGKCNVPIEFRDSNYEDMFPFLEKSCSDCRESSAFLRRIFLVYIEISNQGYRDLYVRNMT